jgi:hypothetical protein
MPPYRTGLMFRFIAWTDERKKRGLNLPAGPLVLMFSTRCRRFESCRHLRRRYCRFGARVTRSCENEFRRPDFAEFIVKGFNNLSDVLDLTPHVIKKGGNQFTMKHSSRQHNRSRRPMITKAELPEIIRGEPSLHGEVGLWLYLLLDVRDPTEGDRDTPGPGRSRIGPKVHPGTGRDL